MGLLGNLTNELLKAITIHNKSLSSKDNSMKTIQARQKRKKRRKHKKLLKKRSNRSKK